MLGPLECSDEYSTRTRTHAKMYTCIHSLQRALFDGIADSVSFECDGKSSMCANGTLTWSCSEQCTSPSNGCSMVLAGAGLRGTIPAALGNLRCAPWINRMCVHAAACLAARAPPAGPLTKARSGSHLNDNTALSGDVPSSAGDFGSLQDLNRA